MRLGVADGNRTRDLLHCRRTLYAKSHSNGVINCHSEPLLVLLQLPHKPRCRKLGIVADTYDTQTRIYSDAWRSEWRASLSSVR